jgi:glutamate N-acetyltransferase/amino-acid N-acetyltransferase
VSANGAGILPAGFSAAGVASGIKASGALDLAVIAAEPPHPLPCAAVFTTNLAAAAPVQVSRRNLAATGGRIGAVVLNSGGANAATGAAGLATAELMAETTAGELGLEAHEVLVCSTGVIGFPLPAGLLPAGIAAAVAARAATDEAAVSAARAIMTTDTREKLSSTLLSSGSHARVTGIAKGAAMLAPNMATMLAVILTDAEATPEQLQAALHHAVRRSFNELTIDGCTSTNDTVVALASGAAGEGPVDGEALTAAVTTVCRDLAHQMAADAEGGTKVVRVVVTGATDDASARRGARQVAEANLVKCSWYGADPNWGRIVSELGTAGIDFDPSLVSVSYGEHTVCRAGVAAVHDTTGLAAYLKGAEIEVRCDLGLGTGTGEVLSADLTHGYIDENMGLS